MRVDVKKLREMFFAELDKKTSWGKNEVKELFKDVLIKYFEEVSEE